VGEKMNTPRYIIKRVHHNVDRTVFWNTYLCISQGAESSAIPSVTQSLQGAAQYPSLEEAHTALQRYEDWYASEVSSQTGAPGNWFASVEKSGSTDAGYSPKNLGAKIAAEFKRDPVQARHDLEWAYRTYLGRPT